jgi:hypothetical protein
MNMILVFMKHDATTPEEKVSMEYLMEVYIKAVIVPVVWILIDGSTGLDITFLNISHAFRDGDFFQIPCMIKSICIYSGYMKSLTTILDSGRNIDFCVILVKIRAQIITYINLFNPDSVFFVPVSIPTV